MNQQAIENRAWLRAELEKRGITTELMERAAYIAGALMPGSAPWFDNYARAYSDGHNNRSLRDKRLGHYASAYADICEEVETVAPGLHMTLEAFWVRWDGGGTFEGSDTEHWHFA